MCPWNSAIATILRMLLSRQTTQTMFVPSGITRESRGNHILVSLPQSATEVLAKVTPSEAIPIWSWVLGDDIQM